MSNRSQWKMMHLLYTLPPSSQAGLTYPELAQTGIDCASDTFQMLVNSGAVIEKDTRYMLSDASAALLGCCMVANRRWNSKDIWVDYPKVFVIMPFSESWSQQVYNDFIKPSIINAELECVRGDTSVRIGDLSQNIWNEIIQAGIIIADVSVVNANVFYEIGLAHALGKDVFILKEKNAKVPADFGGSHYYEYDLNDLTAAKDKLSTDLSAFAAENRFKEVKDLRSK